MLPTISHTPVMKMTCGANGTHDGVIASSLSGAQRCATPAARKNAARIQRMTARGMAERSGCGSEDIRGLNTGGAATPYVVATRNSHRVRRHEATDDDFAAVMHIPDHGFSDRVAAIADHRVFGHRHPLAFDRDP